MGDQVVGYVPHHDFACKLVACLAKMLPCAKMQTSAEWRSG